jgi:2-oxo-3-hexenedioate decarboxylase
MPHTINSNNFAVMNLEAVAKLLDQAASTATATSQISASQSFSEEQAYEIQRMSIEERISRGEKFVGLKLGFTSFAKMEQMGVHDMIWGRLTDAMWYKDGDTLPLDKFIHPRAEPEIAFLLKKDLDREISLNEIPDFIQACAPAIEIIDSRYQNFKFSLEDVIADNCSSSAFVIGAWQPLPNSLNNLEISLSFEKEVIEKDQSNAILDNPFLSICNASRLATKYKQPFLAGQILLAGAATPAVFIEKDKKITAKVATLGSCNIFPK